ncbi:hypothetical protein [Streptomyces sp. NBC_01578]|uniref:hypothetical protein n=1 Tax=Streptomyces sp. NBC_01578 TaxID=2975884 RepID=UPI003864C034
MDFMPNGQAWLSLEHVITAHGGPLSALSGLSDQETLPYVPVTASAKYTMMDGTYLDPTTGLLGTWVDAQEPISLCGGTVVGVGFARRKGVGWGSRVRGVSSRQG